MASRGETERAIELYQRAIRTYNDLPGAWNNLGLLWAETGKNRQAADAFKEAARLSPTDPRPHYNLGVLYEKNNWGKEAAEQYSAALARDEYDLPSLRRAILLDRRMLIATEQTYDRIHRALLIETDEDWHHRFEREQIRVQNQLERQRERERQSGF